ncbi:uncharacterized protein ATC70_001245 [Mucor velutinosus]|uniref:Uncharacterized protein n=1 Tax=Mucor velutinosus TaxID=708070 RepID=A0AAN7I2E3_9FUNG|nr:hypothetical protein ATC70_001245 [Mucor velutinosus]
MFRKLIVKRNYHRHNYTGIADGRRVVDLLRKRYEQKKLQHIDAAEKDKATILSMNTLKQHKWDAKAIKNAQAEDICGFGYTSPNEVFINNELNLSDIKVYGFDYDASILSRSTIRNLAVQTNDSLYSTRWLITPRICH